MEFLKRLFYGFIGAAAFLYFVLKIALSYWKQRGILHEKPKMPWGHLKGVGRKRHLTEALQVLYQKYKGQAPFVGFYAWLKPMVLILDMDCLNNVLNKDAKNFTDRGLYFNVNGDPLTQNLLQTDGLEWQNLQFKSKCLQETKNLTEIYVSGLFKVQQVFEASLQTQLHQAEFVCNVSDLVEGFNIDVISCLAFGLEGDSLRYKHTQFRGWCKNYTQPSNNIYKTYLAFCYPRLARLLQYRQYSSEATSYFQQLINAKLQERARSSQRSCDLLQIYCDHQPLKPMSGEEFAAQAFSFIPAGLDSCTTTVTCCLYELALQPEIQQKARREIHEILRKHENKLDENSLTEMVYLKQILCGELKLTIKDPLFGLPLKLFILFWFQVT